MKVFRANGATNMVALTIVLGLLSRGSFWVDARRHGLRTRLPSSPRHRRMPMGLKVRDIRLEDRLYDIEARLKNRNTRPVRTAPRVTRVYADEGTPTPEDMVDLLIAEVADAERKTRLAEEMTKRAKKKKKKSRNKLPGAKRFFERGQQQQIQVQMQQTR